MVATISAGWVTHAWGWEEDVVEADDRAGRPGRAAAPRPARPDVARSARQPGVRGPRRRAEVPGRDRGAGQVPTGGSPATGSGGSPAAGPGGRPATGPGDGPDALPKPLRASLGSLPSAVAADVAAHLAAAQRLWEDEPDAAVEHARAARDRARRVGAVREAVGLLLYAVGRYGEALPELRAARRMSGRDDLLPVVADAERGVGRPDKALETLTDPRVAGLPPSEQVEAVLVASGAHRDLGRPSEAVALLRPVVQRTRRGAQWWVRLNYAWADALLEAGRPREGWAALRAVATADVDEETDAALRLEAEDASGPSPTDAVAEP